MRRITFVLSWIVAAGLSTGTPLDAQLPVAAPPDVLINDIAASHPASAYIDQSTLLVAEIGWSKIDVDSFFALTAKLKGDYPSDTKVVKELFAKLRAANAGDVYVIAGLETLSDGVPLVVIPTAQPATLLQSMKDIFGDHMRVSPTGNAVLIGKQEQIERFKSITPVKRDDIVTPLRDANRLDHTAVVVLPDLTRELLSRIWPRTRPDGFPSTSSPSQMALDVKRLVVTFRTPPQSQIRLSIESVDEAAAERITKTFAAMKQMLGDQLDQITIKRDQLQVILDADQNAVELFYTAALNARREAAMASHVTTLRRLGIAIYTYENREKHLPPRCFVNPGGQPLHSWLVAILPDIDQVAFYRSIHLDKSWDDPANQQMMNTIPAGIGDNELPRGHTVIRAPVFPGSLWHGDGPPKTWKDVTDDPADTILLADAPPEASVHWADPSPWIISEADPMKDFFGKRDRVQVLMGDGSVRVLGRAEMSNEKLKAMLTIAGGD
ncbi:MAG: DUF1559 domain-containing protein [Planctomycetales bacterium]|nr:DUF1559 domain-containing protein [Planctomycetales bacterium]